MIKSIVFDLGRVILLQNKMNMGGFISKIFNTSLLDGESLYDKYQIDLSIGRISSEQMLRIGKRKFKSTKSINLLKKEWLELYKNEVNGLNHELISLIKKLTIHFKIYLFSNTIDTHAFYFDSLKISNLFLKVFKSYQMGYMKPYKNAYMHILKAIHNDPQETIFIDDLKENVVGAKKIGMKGIVYKNVTQLKADLIKLGVKI